eukprot:6432602-Amphidinium_carterae.1
MDPTPEEISAFTGVGSIMVWAGLRGDPADAASEPASLLDHLSMAVNEQPRFVAALTREQYG